MKKKKKQKYAFTDSPFEILLASATEPMKPEARLHSKTTLLSALDSITKSDNPTKYDWWILSSALNTLETLMLTGAVQKDEHGIESRGWWKDCDGDYVQVTDPDGLHKDAMEALAFAGQRELDGGKIRFDGPGIIAIRHMLEDYFQIIEVIPERAMKVAHRSTERRLQDIFRGKSMRHDVRVVT